MCFPLSCSVLLFGFVLSPYHEGLKFSVLVPVCEVPDGDDRKAEREDDKRHAPELPEAKTKLQDEIQCFNHALPPFWSVGSTS